MPGLVGSDDELVGLEVAAGVLLVVPEGDGGVDDVPGVGDGPAPARTTMVAFMKGWIEQ